MDHFNQLSWFSAKNNMCMWTLKIYVMVFL